MLEDLTQITAIDPRRYHQPAMARRGVANAMNIFPLSADTGGLPMQFDRIVEILGLWPHYVVAGLAVPIVVGVFLGRVLINRA